MCSTIRRYFQEHVPGSTWFDPKKIDDKTYSYNSCEKHWFEINVHAINQRCYGDEPNVF